MVTRCKYSGHRCKSVNGLGYCRKHSRFARPELDRIPNGLLSACAAYLATARKHRSPDTSGQLTFGGGG
jgi:hypothetical protein